MILTSVLEVKVFWISFELFMALAGQLWRASGVWYATIPVTEGNTSTSRSPHLQGKPWSHPSGFNSTRIFNVSQWTVVQLNTVYWGLNQLKWPCRD